MFLFYVVFVLAFFEGFYFCVTMLEFLGDALLAIFVVVCSSYIEK